MSSLSIRPLVAGDESRWRELWDGYLEFYRTALAPDITDAQWQRLLDSTQDPHGLCAVDGYDRVVGFVHYMHHRSTWLIEDRIYLEDLYVDPSAGAAVPAAR